MSKGGMASQPDPTHGNAKFCAPYISDAKPNDAMAAKKNLARLAGTNVDDATLQAMLESLIETDGLMTGPRPEKPAYAANMLMYEAFEMPREGADAKVTMALIMDPNCILAYEWLAGGHDMPQLAVAFYERGAAIGRRLFLGKKKEEYEGFFWGMHETRPFMRCLQGLAECYYEMGLKKEAIEILEEMIELNPNDNQGMRDPLLLYLVEQGAIRKFQKYDKQFKEDYSAFKLFTKALFLFKQNAEGEAAQTALRAAVAANKFVLPKIGTGPRVISTPDMYSFGSEDEAAYYLSYALPVWNAAPGAVAWAKGFYKKAKSQG